MIEVPTVLVLGAGASTDYGYPTAPGLRDAILDSLGGTSSWMYKQLASLAHNGEKIQKFRLEFAESQLPTIDQFLEEHPGFTQIGTEAIACALIPYEQRGNLERKSKRPTWYDHLWDVLSRDIESFEENELTIVTFNYDRSLEQYLGRALEVSKADDVSGKLSSLGFIHVYGTLGGRPYIDNSARPYGRTEDPAAIRKAAKGVVIIDREDDEVYEQFELAEDALVGAKNVIMLGFGYDPTNVSRLSLRDSVQGRDAGVLGTAWKMPKRRQQQIMKMIQLNHQLKLVDTNCLGVFENHFSLR